MNCFSLLALLFVSPAALASADPLGGQDCPGLQAPDQLCAEFAATPSLASDPTVQALRKTCERFYAGAISGLNIICRYKTDSGLHDLASQLAARDEDAPDVAADSALLDRLHEITTRYYAAALEARKAMDAAYKDYKPGLTALAKRGSKLLKKELACEGGGERGVAPGALQVGLAKHSADRLNAAFMPLDQVANRFLYASGGTTISPAGQGKSILALIETFGAPTGAAQTSKTLDPVDGAVPEAPGVDVKGILIQHAKGMVEGAVLVPILGVTPLTLAGSAIQVLTAKKIDALAIANAGIGVVSLALGVSSAGFVVAATAGDFIEATLRAQWAKADAKIVVPYLDYIRTVPGLDSAEAADGYAPRKPELDYCQKCNERDTYYSYCPAKNEYNPHWWDPKVRSGCAKMDWKDPNPAIARGYPLQPAGPGCPQWPSR